MSNELHVKNAIVFPDCKGSLGCPVLLQVSAWWMPKHWREGQV